MRLPDITQYELNGHLFPSPALVIAYLLGSSFTHKRCFGNLSF